MDLRAAAPPVLGHIPWGYGENRITAMARDPYWIFAYWEVTDDALARARAEVRSPSAGCALRVYDTSFKVFDGTNSNWYFDIPVDRAATNYYIHANRPASTFHVDIGVKSQEGYFAKIARSGAVQTPRDGMSPDHHAEWMTVTPESAPAPEYRHRFTPWTGGAPFVPSADLERVLNALTGEGWSRSEWSETDMGGRTVRWVRWSGPYRSGTWREPASGAFANVEIVLQLQPDSNGPAGPWHVTIYGLGSTGERTILDRWTINYSWTDEASIRIQTDAIVVRLLQGYRPVLVPFGSEARLMASAERGFPGSSEVRP